MIKRMEANRLTEIEKLRKKHLEYVAFEVAVAGGTGTALKRDSYDYEWFQSWMIDGFELFLDEYESTIRQQQAEIERLNRAYEVLESKLKEMGSDYPSALSVVAWAHRIKNGELG